MKILVVNCGSSSLKYQIFDIEQGSFNLLAKGSATRIGIEGSIIEHKPSGKEECSIKKPLKNHKEAMLAIEPLLTDDKYGVLEDISEINGIGHRVVHGGEVFKSSVVIDEDVIRDIDKLSKFAPLHNPANLTGIQTCRQLMDAPNVAVFDTAVHQTMPAKAFMYGLPLEYYKNKGIRKYGFHGTSHDFVSAEAAKLIGKPFEQCRIITCHLGNGSSITAFKDGKVQDTSMGLTPLQGVLMGTRCGDVDPAAVLSVMQSDGIMPKQMDEILNKKSGLLGLAGSSDLRDVMNMAEQGNQDAKNAVEILVYSIQKYIGSYLASLGGADAVVFTAGIGENNPIIRDNVLSCFGFAGIKVDKSKNVAGEKVFSTDDSKVKALLIPTNEELMIAMDTYKMIS
ncbi:Acetate kinase [Sedimentisphaera cyanobacteriorum]|uniref:Acetate kinase n=1 Tax=Sedimentisphaera cyanobacteriorum TaxID=1940790 RepID=A0A1Q2HNS1_9BACT|nr:acetate kinase [Sedimentisphaera cyanobacteriorum]AQQ08886.1 Acetate kinase [Sedimentisphaera cyanobacteriorum]